jgi:hypothetical protein
LHKIIFEEDGLPDGAEVAYYARGQVVCGVFHVKIIVCVFLC